MLSFRFLFSLSILCLLTTKVTAQTSDKSPPPVQVRMLFLDESQGQGYSVKLEEGFQKVSSYPYAISNMILRPAGSELEVYKNLPPPPPNPQQNIRNQDTESPRVKIATLKVPDKTTSVLAVIRPGDSKADTHVALYNSDLQHYPENAIRIINLGLTPIAASINDKVKKIAPGNLAVFTPNPDPKNRVVVQVAQQGKDNWKYIYDSVQVLKPGNRVTGVVVFSPSGMRHTYTALEIQEFGEPKPRHQWLSYIDTP
ncbi:hypothetical protein P3T73_10700 [Kiritimatiellota bacterium B12222]|nr:hypothetical protein P3T73_10700 [Kiritimatiellota bacterium B12222]